MASAYTVAGKYGGVAFIGNTRIGYDYYNKLMEVSFGDYINKNYTIGQSVLMPNYACNSTYAKFTRHLIGDPDINIWINSPDKPTYTLNGNSSRISIIGNLMTSSEIAIFDGIENSISFKPISASTNNSFYIGSLHGIGNDYVATIFNRNCLPFTKLIYNGSNLNVRKKYFLNSDIVSNSLITSEFSYYINNGGKLELTVLDFLRTKCGFKINCGGAVAIECMGTVNLAGDVISSGGSLSVKSESVRLEPGFKVEKGGMLSITVESY